MNNQSHINLDEDNSQLTAAAPRKQRQRAEHLNKKRNRIIANIMIYSGIGILLILCIIVSAILFMGQNGVGITDIDFIDDSLTLRAGHIKQLTVATQPVGNEYALTFSSSDSSIAQVSSDGTVTAQKQGTAVITVTSGGLSAKCTVTVKRDTIDTLKTSLDELNISGGQQINVGCTFSPSDAADRNIVYKSSDSSIAEVDKNGVVKGVQKGTAIITVEDTVTGIRKEITVSVTSLEIPDSMEFFEKEITLEVGDTYTAELKFTPDNISETSAIYYTTDSSVASVTNEGLITAKGVGSCRIEAYYSNDYTLVAIMDVIVIDPFVIIDTDTSDSVPESAPESVPESQPIGKPESDSQYAGKQPDIEVRDGITYVDGILIANKTYSLPSDYNPGVDSEAYNALCEMENAAATDGIVLFVVSGFRDYDTQEAIYNRYVYQSGQAAADTFSARPGHSEHQTGLAFDLNSLEESFGDTPEGKWLAENCCKYGFIIRYPKGKDDITGYMYEPWHVRYLGKDIAQKVYKSGLTLEEYLGITSRYVD